MTAALQRLVRATISPYRLIALAAAGLTLLVAVILRLAGASPLPLLLAMALIGVLWLALRYPVTGLGAFLIVMPEFTLLFLIAKFFGPGFIGSLEGIDRAVLFLLLAILIYKYRIKLKLPDYLILACFFLVAIRLPFDGSPLALVADFGFLLPYTAGRYVNLTDEQIIRWARRAVWITAFLSVIGLIEVLFVGQGPRTLLYLSVAEKATSGDALNASFRASGFTGMRASSTMLGPLQFGPLCMVGLIVWWVFGENLILGLLIVAGLVSTLSRSAWLGAFLAIPLTSMLIGQYTRFLRYLVIGSLAFVLALPFLGIGNFLTATKSGEDVSAQQHHDSLASGLQYIATHPMGGGSANMGRQATKSNDNATYFESMYLTFASEYGWLPLLLFLGFLASCIFLLWNSRTPLGITAVGIVFGFAGTLSVLSIHDVFPLACWVWFPVGLALQRAQPRQKVV